MKVLLAVKDRDLRSILRAYLRGLDHDIDVVRSGLACISRMSEATPDVLILQQGLLWGGSNGVLQWVQQELKHKQMTVVVLPRIDCDGDSAAATLCLEELLQIGEVLSKLKHTESFCFNAFDRINLGAQVK